MKDLILFFDGCHKIYYAERSDTETIEQMKSYGYEVIDGDFDENLKDLWLQSCMLRFVQPADLDVKKPEVPQGRSGQLSGLRGFSAKLKNYKEASNASSNR